MDSIFFTLQLAIVILIVVWAMRNDRAGDADSQTGLLAICRGRPDEPRSANRIAQQDERRRHQSSLNRKSRSISKKTQL